MRVAVVTSVYGGYDDLATPPEQSVDCEWVCVTDDPSLDGRGWKVVVEPRPGLSSRLAAKVGKTQPWLYAPSAEAWVWLDTSFLVQDERSVERLVAAGYGHAYAQFGHPQRNCVYDEAHFSVPLSKYAHQPVLQQLDHYAEAGFPRHWGLWATGTIVYGAVDLLTHGARVRAGEHWLLEQVRWTDQDQVSQGPVLRYHDLRPVTLPGHLLANSYVHLRPHRDGT